jgi:hypothetical protein
MELHMAKGAKGEPKTPGSGRKKGTPNKTTALLKDAILQAAELAGGEKGLVAYLARQAIENPGPFMALLGKVLPLQIGGDEASGPITFTWQQPGEFGGEDANGKPFSIHTGVPRPGDKKIDDVPSFTTPLIGGAIRAAALPGPAAYVSRSEVIPPPPEPEPERQQPVRPQQPPRPRPHMVPNGGVPRFDLD